MQDGSSGRHCCERRPLVAVCAKSKAGASDLTSSWARAGRLPRLAASHHPRPPFATTAVSIPFYHAPRCPGASSSFVFSLLLADLPPSPSLARQCTPPTAAYNNARKPPREVREHLGDVQGTSLNVCGWYLRGISAQRRTGNQVRRHRLRFTTHSPT